RGTILLAFLTATFVFALALFQASGPVAGPRLAGRLGAALIEIDRWLPAHRDDIEVSARERPRTSIDVNGLPIDVSIPAAAVKDNGGAMLGTAIVAAMGQRLYRDGWAAFDGNGSISVAEPAR